MTRADPGECQSHRKVSDRDPVNAEIYHGCDAGDTNACRFGSNRNVETTESCDKTPKVSSAHLRSSMSVTNPYHLMMFPSSSRSGTLRSKCQRYCPSERAEPASNDGVLRAWRLSRCGPGRHASSVALQTPRTGGHFRLIGARELKESRWPNAGHRRCRRWGWCRIQCAR